MDVHELARELAHPEALNRRRAVRAAAGFPDLWTVHALSQVVAHDPDPALRELANKALRSTEDTLLRRGIPFIPRATTPADPAGRVVAALQSDAPATREAGVTAVALARNVGLLDRLCEVARVEADPAVLAVCCKALGMLGSKREARELLRYVEHGDDGVKAAAVLSLTMLGHEWAYVLLARLAARAPGVVRQEALRFLGALGAPRLSRLLTYMVGASDPGVATAGVDVCVLLGAGPLLSLAARALHHPEEYVRARAEAVLTAQVKSGSALAKKLLAEAPAEDRAASPHAVAQPHAAVQPRAPAPPESAASPSLGGLPVPEALPEPPASPAPGWGQAAPPAPPSSPSPSPSSPAAAADETDDDSPPSPADEAFERERRELLTQTVDLKVNDAFRQRTGADRARDRLAVLATAAVAAVLLGLPAAVGAAGLYLLAQVYAQDAWLDPMASVPPALVLLALAWVLRRPGRAAPHVPLSLREHPKLAHLLQVTAQRMSGEAPATVVLEHSGTVDVLDVPTVPLLPLGATRTLVLGAFILEHVSTQELKALLARSMARVAMADMLLPAWPRQSLCALDRLVELYAAPSGLKAYVNPAGWALRAARAVLLTLLAPGLRRLELAGDTAAAASLGANVVREAITQHAVMTTLLGDLARDFLVERRASRIAPVNLYGEILGGVQWKLENGVKHVRGRLLTRTTGALDPTPCLKERVEAIERGEARRTRIRRPSGSLFERRASLEKELTALVWRRGR